jgi:hypothetical protein
MPSLEERVQRLERRVEGIEEHFNDVLESLAQRWATLSDAAREAAAEIARVAKERETKERLNLGKKPNSV